MVFISLMAVLTIGCLFVATSAESTAETDYSKMTLKNAIVTGEYFQDDNDYKFKYNRG